MEASLIVYSIYLFLAVFNAGNMLTLQIQHYGIYSFIAKESFKEYITANNKAAVVPSILPAMLLLIVNIILLFSRPVFMSLTIAIVSLVLNIIALTSTIKWQRKLQGQMAVEGYNGNKINLLNSTNWIRTIAFLTEGVIAVAVIMSAVK
jgi:hypothetical protein